MYRALAPGAPCAAVGACTLGDCVDGSCTELPPGAACTVDGASGNCNEGFCAKLAPGTDCDKNAECASVGCDLGISLLASFAPCAANTQCMSCLPAPTVPLASNAPPHYEPPAPATRSLLATSAPQTLTARPGPDIGTESATNSRLVPGALLIATAQAACACSSRVARHAGPTGTA